MEDGAAQDTNKYEPDIIRRAYIGSQGGDHVDRVAVGCRSGALAPSVRSVQF